MGQAMARAVDPSFDRTKIIPVTDVLRRRLPHFETTAAAARSLGQAWRTDRLTKLYAEQVDRPELVLPSLFLLADNERRRVTVYWRNEDEPAQLDSVELYGLHRGPWFGYLDREQVEQLWLPNEAAMAVRAAERPLDRAIRELLDAGMMPGKGFCDLVRDRGGGWRHKQKGTKRLGFSDRNIRTRTRLLKSR
jgi:hypothetical protein